MRIPESSSITMPIKAFEELVEAEKEVAASQGQCQLIYGLNEILLGHLTADAVFCPPSEAFKLIDKEGKLWAALLTIAETLRVIAEERAYEAEGESSDEEGSPGSEPHAASGGGFRSH